MRTSTYHCGQLYIVIDPVVSRAPAAGPMTFLGFQVLQTLPLFSASIGISSDSGSDWPLIGWAGLRLQLWPPACPRAIFIANTCTCSCKEDPFDLFNYRKGVGNLMAEAMGGIPLNPGSVSSRRHAFANLQNRRQSRPSDHGRSR